MILTIRKEQTNALEVIARRRFVSELTIRLRDEHPAKTAALSDQEIKEIVHLGIERGALYGVLKNEEVSRYLGFMLTFGSHFDVDPKCDWAGQVLRTARLSGAQKLDYIVRLRHTLDQLE